jgi:hypothetical protein
LRKQSVTDTELVVAGGSVAAHRSLFGILGTGYFAGFSVIPSKLFPTARVRPQWASLTTSAGWRLRLHF